MKCGLEIHGYIETEEKLFCSCKAVHGAKHSKPNENICPICTAQPGSKPLLPNSQAITKAIEIALILGCKINEKLVWQRKHYNWADLPKGFQNTISGPYAIPVGVKGKFLGIGITEAHLEEDPAAWNPETGEIDYNRSGCPLIEIVTDPDFKSPEQVVEWLKQLITTLSYIKAIDKFAGIKADVNVSIEGGERIEIKNMNSLANIEKAIKAEVARQEKDLPKEKETRRYDEGKNTTIKMRSKENAEDYRFISDPDLPVVNLDKKRIEALRKNLPETPLEKLEKLIKKFKIDKKSAEVLTKKLEIVDFFEKVVEKSEPELALSWVTVELLGKLNYAKKNLDDEDVEIKPEHFIELLNLIKENKITVLKAKEILQKFIPKSFSPKEVAKENQVISNKNEIEDFCDKAINENQKAVADYKAGNENALNFVIGSVMKLSNKRADFNSVKDILKKKLK